MTVMLEWPLRAIKASPLALWILLPEIIPPPDVLHKATEDQLAVRKYFGKYSVI